MRIYTSGDSMARKPPKALPPPPPQLVAILGEIGGAKALTLGNAGFPDPLPEVAVLETVPSPSGKTVRALVRTAGGEREVRVSVPTGIELTEGYLGAAWQDFAKLVPQMFLEGCVEGEIQTPKPLGFDAVKGLKLWRTEQWSQRGGGVWWILADESPRVVGLGFLRTYGISFAVQTGLMWRSQDRGGGLYRQVLGVLREWARPGTIYSDTHLSVLALRSWQADADAGTSTFDPSANRYRRNPRKRRR